MSMSKLRYRAIAPALLLALAAFVGGRDAEAGLGIIVTDTILMPVEDPLAQYDFKLSLVAGNQILQGDNITLLNVPDFSGAASYVFVSGGINYSQFFSIQTTAGTNGFSTIELVLTASPGSLTNTSQVNNLPIGDLFVTTTVPYPPPAGSPLFNPINYTTQTHLFPGGTLNTGSGITPTPTLSVPEPSSLALLGVGVASCGVMIRGRRRRA